MSYSKTQHTEILYYNIGINNSGASVSGLTYGDDAGFIKAKVSANNNTPILENPSKYFASVVRMEVPSFAIPLVNILIKTPINTINDINTMINSFTLQYGNFYSAQTFFQWTTQITSTSQLFPKYIFPAQQQIFSPYYFGYSIFQWVDIMNTALATAMTDLKAQVPAIASANNPFFVYNPETELMSLYADKNFFNNSLTTPIQIYTNSVSSQSFNGFWFDERNVGSATGIDEVFIIKSNNTVNDKTINSVVYIEMQQEFVSLAYLSPLKSIILSTNMNVVSEVFFINNPNALQNQNYINVLTDFLPDISGASEAGVGSKIFIYNATALWRLFQFTDENPLYNFSLSLNWQDVNGNVYPLELVKGTQCNVKMMFIRKDLYHPDIDLQLTNDKKINPRTTGFPQPYIKSFKNYSN
jgi:hypothetical protein